MLLYCVASCTCQSQISFVPSSHQLHKTLAQPGKIVMRRQSPMRYTLTHDFKKSVLPIVLRCVHLTGNQRLPVSFLNQVIGPMPVSMCVSPDYPFLFFFKLHFAYLNGYCQRWWNRNMIGGGWRERLRSSRLSTRSIHVERQELEAGLTPLPQFCCPWVLLCNS